MNKFKEEIKIYSLYTLNRTGEEEKTLSAIFEIFSNSKGKLKDMPENNVLQASQLTTENMKCINDMVNNQFTPKDINLLIIDYIFIDIYLFLKFIEKKENQDQMLSFFYKNWVNSGDIYCYPLSFIDGLDKYYIKNKSLIKSRADFFAKPHPPQIYILHDTSLCK